MRNEAEQKVSRFYNAGGWEVSNGITGDADRWEDTRVCSQEYVKKCRMRVMEYVPSHGEYILDMASGPIQYPEYIEYSKNFDKRYCVDLSISALLQAKIKIGVHGIYLNGSFLDLNFSKDYFDCSLSLHTIYHVDKDEQEKVVRKMIHVTKKNRPIVIVYSNPKTLIFYLKKVFYIFRKKKHVKSKNNDELYYYAHELKWWDRFHDQAEIKVMPWRSFNSNEMKCFIPDNLLGKFMLNTLFRLENRLPNIFVKFFQYHVIVLLKK